jgi:SAM-dependent methyltransferase
MKAVVREKYGAIARSAAPGGCCGLESCAPEGLETTFVDGDYAKLPGYEKSADLGLGCGLPTEGAGILPGHTVVDLGSGAGNDAFVARRAVGETGRVIGVDMTPAMVERAEANNRKLGYSNVSFVLGEIERLPLAAGTADVVVSNCVLNLVPDKPRAFREMFRVLRAGGHFRVSDIVLEGDLPPRAREAAELYVGCVSGAVPREDYLRGIREAGFVDVEVQKEHRVALPREVLVNILGEAGTRELEASGAGAVSVTVYGRKP